MKIIWSPQANQNLNKIVEKIALDKYETAFRWAKTVEKKVSRLKNFPKSGRVVPELGREEIREILVGSYRIIYKLEEFVSILAVLHGSRKLPTDLKNIS